MAPGGPPGAGRGRGGKFKKFTRGGGKHFSRDLRPLDSNGNEIRKENEKESSSSEEDSSEEDSEPSENAQPTNLNREERRAAARARKDAAIAKKKGRVVEAGDLPTSSENESEDEPMPLNPNHSKASRNQTKAIPLNVEENTKRTKDLSIGASGKGKSLGDLSRREREAVQAQQAKERYQKLNEAGKTDEAKADLARLKLIREKRESEAARKLAEREEREAFEKAKKADINAREAKRREAALGSKKANSKK